MSDLRNVVVLVSIGHEIELVEGCFLLGSVVDVFGLDALVHLGSWFV